MSDRIRGPLEIQISIEGIDGRDHVEVEQKARSILGELLDTEHFGVSSLHVEPRVGPSGYLSWSVTATPAARSSDVARRLGQP